MIDVLFKLLLPLSQKKNDMAKQYQAFGVSDVSDEPVV